MNGTSVETISISKTAQSRAAFRRPLFEFRSAREAFQAFLLACGVTPGDPILLPSFVGWSSREGSGVFDPVVNIHAEPIFYRIDEHLLIDVKDVQRNIKKRKPRVLVLIHYFGYPDPNAEAVAAFARERGIVVLEDEAHAMLSDLIGGVCGRWGDAAIFAFHKILPFADGGALLLNPPIPELWRGRLLETQMDGELKPLWEYDLCEIARARRRNAERLIAGLAPMRSRVQTLYSSLPAGIVPQTLPIVILRKSRNDLYHEMNAAGFGVVSLYHTLISPIARDQFPESHALASRIMNLPVHQDIEPEQLSAMINKLRELT